MNPPVNQPEDYLPKYHKINSLWKRGADHRLLVGEWSTPELEALADINWVWREKVDGTNIRLFNSNGHLVIRGRTDKAELPPALVAHLRETIDPERIPPDAVLYGEGYGGRIQKVGPKYSEEPRFILFDVRAGRFWLREGVVTDIAEQVGVRRVPLVGLGPLHAAVQYVLDGPQSEVSAEPLRMEGVVCVPQVRLLDAQGRRIVCKIKWKDLCQVSVGVVQMWASGSEWRR